MLLLALIIGVILIVAAVRNSQDALFSALMQDVPDFVVWAAAIIALGAVGYVPGLKPVSRGLLMLVITVIVLRNYKTIIAGFQNAWQNPPAPDSGTTTVDAGVVPSGGANDNSVVTAPNQSTFSSAAPTQDYTLDAFIQKFGYAPGSAQDPYRAQNAGTAAALGLGH